MKLGWALALMIILEGCVTFHEPTTDHQTLVVGKIHFTGSGMTPPLLNGDREGGFTVRIQNLGDKTIYSSRSSDSGVVSFLDLPPGAYALLDLAIHIQASNYTGDFTYRPRGHDWLFEVIPNQVNNLGKFLWTLKVTGQGTTSDVGRGSSTKLVVTQDHTVNSGYDETRQDFQELHPQSEWLTLAWIQQPFVSSSAPTMASTLKLSASIVQQELGEQPFQLSLTSTVANDLSSVSWSSTNPKVATVTPTGLVTALGAGTTQITASGPHGPASSLMVVWKQDPPQTYTYYSDDPASYNWTLWHVPKDWTAQPLADHPLTVTLEKLSGQPTAVYGILFCYQDSKNFYELLVDALGNYELAKNVKGQLEKISRLQPGPGVLPGVGKANIFVISQPSQGNFAITANGVALAHFSDDTFSGGQVALFASVGTAQQNPPENFPQTPEKIQYTFGSSTPQASADH